VELVLEDALPIGENEIGYSFLVARIGDRWIGFADSSVGMFLLPGVREGQYIGVKDKKEAILLSGAIAQSIEHGYGGVDEWFVPEDLRGKPEDYRCKTCSEIGCKGYCLE